MASSKQATKPIQKIILDATKVSSSSEFAQFVRRPPIDPNRPIQGRPRDTSSNAFKDYIQRESARLQKALNSISHGKHIFAYHNVRTKQVVYSLTRYLEVRISSLALTCHCESYDICFETRLFHAANI